VNPLVNAMSRFARAYNRRPDLMAEQRGWICTIALVASDSSASVAVRLENGLITCISDQAEADVVITSDEATLRDILELRRGPNEPYLFGDLTVRGRERDFLRLDYIAGVLCPE